MKKQPKSKSPKLPPGTKVVTHLSGRQVVVADTEAVKSGMQPTTTAKAKTKRVPGESPATQKQKEAVYLFAQNVYPKILPYFTTRNPHYKVCAKYLNPEDVLHIAICALIKEYFPELKVSHAKNEGKEGHVGQAKKVMMGIESGFSDLMVQSSGKMKCLFMEVKVKPNRLTAEQNAFLDFQAECRHHTAVVYDMEQALFVLQEYCRVL